MKLPKNKPRILRFDLQDKFDMNEEAVDLVESILAFNPEWRFTAEEALEHDYFKTQL